MVVKHDFDRVFTPRVFQQGSGECIVETTFQTPYDPVKDNIDLSLIFEVDYATRPITSNSQEKEYAESLHLHVHGNPQYATPNHYIKNGYHTLPDAHLSVEGRKLLCRLIKEVGEKIYNDSEWGEVKIVEYEAEWWVAGEVQDPALYREQVKALINLKRLELFKERSPAPQTERSIGGRAPRKSGQFTSSPTEEEWFNWPTNVLQKKPVIVRNAMGELVTLEYWA